MRIESFRIRGFKSIADLEVNDLSDINVFFGLNDVGKSNIFQALELWSFLASKPHSDEFDIEDLQRRFGKLFIRFGQRSETEISVYLTGLEEAPAIRVKVTISDYSQRDNSFLYHIEETIIDGGREIPYSLNDHSRLRLLHIIDAHRRINQEKRDSKAELGSITSDNLKQALFYAYLSSDQSQKRRLGAIKNHLAQPPYQLGELDIALDPANDEIQIGFVRADGRLPIENLGSGMQQLLLVLGQLFLNSDPIVAIEEPEMNLSPQHQQHLMATLRSLMSDPAIQFKQLFVSTHSPYLEFTENFYDVTHDPVKGTIVKQATDDSYKQHFQLSRMGPDTGARLNSLNQVELYDGLIQDLGLKRGDLVIFARNEQGRWEVRPAKELSKELQQITNGRVGRNGS